MWCDDVRHKDNLEGALDSLPWRRREVRPRVDPSSERFEKGREERIEEAIAAARTNDPISSPC